MTSDSKITALPGEITYPGGSVAFGSGKPTVCVNDQCGYLIEDQAVQEKLLHHDFSPLISLASEGMAAGFTFFNVQLMVPALMERELDLMPRIIETLLEEVGCGIAVDTKNPRVLSAALSIYPGKALCNCVTAEQASLDSLLPIIAEHGAAVGTALTGDEGIPDTLSGRIRLGARIVEAAEKRGIPRDDVLLDGVCYPAGAAPGSMPLTLQTLQAFKKELGTPTLLGSSNAGFGMPEPLLLDGVFFIASVAWGLDLAMISPRTPRIAWYREAIDFLMGTDLYAEKYLELYRRNLHQSS
jgi:5-methyltetrahydrofolate--homocysteine methyltransferase